MASPDLAWFKIETEVIGAGGIKPSGAYLKLSFRWMIDKTSTTIGACGCSGGVAANSRKGMDWLPMVPVEGPANGGADRIRRLNIKGFKRIAGSSAVGQGANMQPDFYITYNFEHCCLAVSAKNEYLWSRQNLYRRRRRRRNCYRR